MSSFPEPLSFNGGPDETGGYVGRSTGPYREEPVGYRCTVCGWKGLALEAYQHHRIAHHPIELVNGVRTHFSCCTPKAEDRLMADCPICGAPLEPEGCPDCLWTPTEDPRERLDDDGREFPRDAREDRR